MSKISIISQPNEGVLIDIGGCTTMQEATEHLSSTLQVSSQFWHGVNVALNLGDLELSSAQVAQLMAIAKGVGATPKEVFAENATTRVSLKEQHVAIADGKPMTLPPVSDENLVQQDLNSVITDEGTEELGEESETEAPTATAEPSEETITVFETSESKPVISAEEIAQAIRPLIPSVLYLRQTLRSGQTVSHKGHLVIIGDVNPGAEVMAEGDITVWGYLRGIAHAGIGGNIDSEIRALKLQPIQIRIAHAIARSPDRPRLKYSTKTGPEVARIVDGKIRITRMHAPQ